MLWKLDFCFGLTFCHNVKFLLMPYNIHNVLSSNISLNNHDVTWTATGTCMKHEASINTQMLGLDCTSAVCMLCWSKWPSWGLLSNIYKDLAFFDSFFENVKPFPAIEFRYPREYKKSLYTVSCPEFLKININVFCLISNFSLTNFCLSLHKVLNSK